MGEFVGLFVGEVHPLGGDHAREVHGLGGVADQSAVLYGQGEHQREDGVDLAHRRRRAALAQLSYPRLDLGMADIGQAHVLPPGQDVLAQDALVPLAGRWFEVCLGLEPPGRPVGDGDPGAGGVDVAADELGGLDARQVPLGVGLAVEGLRPLLTVRIAVARIPARLTVADPLLDTRHVCPSRPITVADANPALPDASARGSERRQRFDPAGADEVLEFVHRDPDVAPELDEGDAPLGDQSANEPQRRVEPSCGLFDGAQLYEHPGLPEFAGPPVPAVPVGTSQSDYLYVDTLGVGDRCCREGG